MADDGRLSQRGVGSAQRGNQRHQGSVLLCRVSPIVGALELYADREVVAGDPALVARPSGVPCPPIERHVLRELAVARDQHMRRHLETGDRREIRIDGGGQRVAEKAVDPAPAESAGREADTVHHDQRQLRSRGPRVVIGRRDAPYPTHPACLGVDDHAKSSNLLKCVMTRLRTISACRRRPPRDFG